MNDTPDIDNAALNRLLATDVMGWEIRATCDLHGKTPRPYIHREPTGRLWLWNSQYGGHYWHPTNDANQAFEVLEKWCDGGKVGCWMMTGHQAQGRHGDWQHFRVHLYRDADECEGPSVTAAGPTLPLAICRAVYAAVKGQTQ